MTNEEKQTLIDYRMERARESLQAAQLLFDNNMLIPAMNRLYYSMFYSVSALLVLHNCTFSRHGQVKGFFNREFIKSGIMPVEFGKLYNAVFEYRQKFDYSDFVVPDREMVSNFLIKITKFIEEIEKYLESKI